ncbi:MAG: DUF502 domain-containing protein [Planctomycetota bacterium]
MSDTPDNNPMPEEAAQAGETADDLVVKPKKQPRNSTRFIIRGMATLLPAVLTLWLLVFAYGFVRDKIAAPINWGVQGIVIQFTDWPIPTDEDFADVWQSEDYLTATQREAWEDELSTFGELNDRERRERRLLWMKGQPEIILDARRVQLEKKWNSIAIGQWQVLDIIGLIIAIILFYFAGALMSNVIGRQLKNRGEKLIDRVPLIRRVYPAVKQVTDFFFGDSDQQIKFNRVVAVEYPRKGLYSVGLVTGDTMQTIEDAMGEPCLTVFVPSSPTPFTGYVITVPVADTIDLGITIEDALKFAVSGGVLVPPSQTIDRSNAPYDRRGETGDRRALPESS